MKRLIVEEVNSFRAEVRAQARAAAGQLETRRQERCVVVYLWPLAHLIFHYSLPIPSRDEIMSSPVQVQYGATSSFTTVSSTAERPSPVMDDPSEELERELSGTHPGGRR